jgi:hypothetical protein
MAAPKKITAIHTIYWVSYGPDAYHWQHTVKRIESLRAAKQALANKPAWGKSWVVMRSRDTMFSRVDMKVVAASDSWTKEMAQQFIEKLRPTWKTNPKGQHKVIEGVSGCKWLVQRTNDRRPSRKWKLLKALPRGARTTKRANPKRATNTDSRQGPPRAVRAPTWAAPKGGWSVAGTDYGYLHSTGGEVRVWRSRSGAARVAKQYARRKQTTNPKNPPMSQAEAMAIRRILKRHGY